MIPDLRKIGNSYKVYIEMFHNKKGYNVYFLDFESLQFVKQVPEDPFLTVSTTCLGSDGLRSLGPERRDGNLTEHKRGTPVLYTCPSNKHSTRISNPVSLFSHTPSLLLGYTLRKRTPVTVLFEPKLGKILKDLSNVYRESQKLNSWLSLFTNRGL